MASIRYFIPEDGDTEDQPNVFLAPKPAQPGFSPKLGEIRQAFPLPGRYHFRFKAPLVPGSDRDKDCIPVWMDCVDDHQHVSVWRGGIFAKVTRISLDHDAFVVEERSSSMSSSDLSSGYKHVEMPSQSVHSSSSGSSTNLGVSQHGLSSTTTPAVTETLLDVFDAPSAVSSSTVSSSSSVPPPATTTDPLSLFGGGVPTAAPAQMNGGLEGSLLDMDAPVYASSSVPNHFSSTAHTDFLGMTVTANDVQNASRPTAPSAVLPMTATQPTVTIPPAIQSKLPPNRSGSSFNISQKGPFGDLGWK